MNVQITFNKTEVTKKVETVNQREADKIKNELNNLFKTKISSPEQVRYIYTLMQKYERFSGKQYTKTFEENTIV